MQLKVAKPQKPVTLTLDRNGKHYRGGQVRSITANQSVIRLHLEANWIDERMAALSIFESPAPVGQAVYAEVDPANDYAIVKVYPSVPADQTLEQRFEKDRDTFCPGRVLPKHGGN